MATSAVIPVPAALPAVQKEGFKRLRMKHRRIIALHLAGEPNVDIASTLGHHPAYISMVLRDPLVKTVLEAAYSDYEMEIRALTPSAIEAVRKHLDSADGSVALRAADMAFKINGRYEQREENRVTAEDVIERILQTVGADGSRLQYTERRFLRQTKSQIGNDSEETT